MNTIHFWMTIHQTLHSATISPITVSFLTKMYKQCNVDQDKQGYGPRTSNNHLWLTLARKPPTTRWAISVSRSIMRMIPTPLGNGPPMQKVTLCVWASRLRENSMGCWKAFQAHTGPCNYLRIAGKGSEQLQQGEDGGIDRAWLTDQVPALLPASNPEKTSEISIDETLTVVEVQQFQQPQTENLDGYGTQVTSLLEEHGLRPTRFLHFGRDQELPQQDTLAFTHLESWNKKSYAMRLGSQQFEQLLV